MNKLALAFAAASLFAASAAQAEMTFAEKQAMVPHAYVMEAKPGKPMKVVTFAEKQAKVAHAYVMEAKPAKEGQWKYKPSLRALEQAKVKHAYEWK